MTIQAQTVKTITLQRWFQILCNFAEHFKESELKCNELLYFTLITVNKYITSLKYSTNVFCVK